MTKLTERNLATSQISWLAMEEILWHSAPANGAGGYDHAARLKHLSLETTRDMTCSYKYAHLSFKNVVKGLCHWANQQFSDYFAYM